MFRPLALLAGLLVLAACASAPQAPRAELIAAALSASDRPAGDAARDEQRHAAELLDFSRVAPGDRVLDVGSGGGYFTRLLSSVAGPTGHVVAQDHPDLVDQIAEERDAMLRDRPNVSAMTAPFETLEGAPESYDLVVITNFYHDIVSLGDRAAMNRRVYELLKPGGLYLIADHAAEAGSGDRDVRTLHRIDPALVRADTAAAGFVLIDETDALANPDDDLTLRIFDEQIRGRTSQFALLFAKPAR